MAKRVPDPAGLSARPFIPASLPKGRWRARGLWARLLLVP